jgi:hypothetical protein
VPRLAKLLRVPTPADHGPGQPWRPGTPVLLALAPDTQTADIRIGYARCSTLTQELQSQLDALTKHGIPRDKVFSEKISTRVRPQFEAALALARQIKAHAPHCLVIFTVYEMKRLGRDAAELTALADHLTAHDMLHTVLRRRANGESAEQIQPDLIIPTGKRKGQAPSVASIYRALAEHEKKEAYPEAVEAAHADFADLQDVDGIPRPRRVRIRRPDDPLTLEEADLRQRLQTRSSSPPRPSNQPDQSLGANRCSVVPRGRSRPDLPSRTRRGHTGRYAASGHRLRGRRTATGRRDGLHRRCGRRA